MKKGDLIKLTPNTVVNSGDKLVCGILIDFPRTETNRGPYYAALLFYPTDTDDNDMTFLYSLLGEEFELVI